MDRFEGLQYTRILEDIRNQQLAPVYYLHGEEGYFIDAIMHALDAEGAVLQPFERDFNREQFYGPDTQAAQIINACRSFPVMAARRLVLVREAHRLPKGEADKLAAYLKQPLGSTVLALAFKDRKAGLSKAGEEALAASRAVKYHAKKLYDADIQRWADHYIQTQGFSAEPGIAAVLVTNLGPNLGLIENELEKMFISLRAQGQTQLRKEFVFQMINIDKEFNVFELIHALAERDVYRSHLIMDRLVQNTKINPPVLLISGLFQFFHQAGKVRALNLKDVNSIKERLKVNYYQAKDYASAVQQYGGALGRIIGYIREADLMLKGQIPTNLDERHILKTLVWKMLAR
ncbi:MAG: DNA polymerase III subunit delta [Bacteroidia bacterium]|nr:DNA polymerase III subunit delta [Bacteroidia bacterium]